MLIRTACATGVVIDGSLELLKLIAKAHTIVEVREIHLETIDEEARRGMHLKWKVGLL